MRRILALCAVLLVVAAGPAGAQCSSSPPEPQRRVGSGHRESCSASGVPGAPSGRCSTGGAASDGGRVVFHQSAQRDDAGPAARACSAAWVILSVPTGGRDPVPVTTDIEVDAAGAESTRSTSAVAPSAGRSAATSLAFVSVKAPPEPLAPGSCARSEAFRAQEMIAEVPVLSIDKPGRQFIQDQRVALRYEIPNPTKAQRVQVHVGILGDLEHELPGAIDQFLDAIVTLPFVSPCAGSTIGEVKPQQIVTDEPVAGPATAGEPRAALPSAPAPGGGGDEVSAGPFTDAVSGDGASRAAAAPFADGRRLPSAGLGSLEEATQRSSGGLPLPATLLAAAALGAVAVGARRQRKAGAAVVSDRVPTKPLLERVGGIGQAIGAVAGAVTAVAVLLFLVRPDLEPTTTNDVAINDITVEHGVTLAQYVEHPTVAAVLERGGDREVVVDANAEFLHDVGAVVHYTFEASGYASKKIVTRWTMFDGATGARLQESEGRDPLPFSFRSEKTTTDIGSWETWIRSGGNSGRSVFVRMELYDAGKGVRLAFKDTERFALP